MRFFSTRFHYPPKKLQRLFKPTFEVYLEFTQNVMDFFLRKYLTVKTISAKKLHAHNTHQNTGSKYTSETHIKSTS